MSHPAPPGPEAGLRHDTGADDRSLGQIVSDVSSDLTTLMRQELELAKVELKQEVAQAGKGAGMLGGAGLAGCFVLLFLSVALVFLLDNWLPIEAAALITAGAVGRSSPPCWRWWGARSSGRPTRSCPMTQQSLKEDAQWAKAQKS